MEALEAILSRRSIRHYTNKPIAEGMVKKLLEAGMSSPSACDFQPWHFVVITERRLLGEIPTFHPHAAMLPEAPLAVLVCGEPDTSRYWQQDCSAAAQNILLAAHALGLGGVWLGVYPREQRVAPLRKMFNLPESITPLALIAVGYPAESLPPQGKYNEAKVHYNKW